MKLGESPGPFSKILRLPASDSAADVNLRDKPQVTSSFMSTEYGSDNPECATAEQYAFDPNTHAARSIRSRWKKVAMASVGAVLCIGGALVMYDGWNEGVRTPVAMTLASTDYTSVSSDYNLIKSGQPVLLRARGKGNLCMDDGGGRTNAETKFVLQTCDPESPNQVFTYDATTRMFKSVNKPGMCMDDGGSTSSGTATMHLWECVSSTPNQRFTMDSATMMIKSPDKSNLCVDDGGGTTAGSSKFWLFTCVNDNSNQHFDVLSQAAMLTVLKNERTVAGTQPVFDLLMSGKPLMLRVRGKNNLCMDDGGGHTNAETKFVDQTCDPDSPNQIFTYEPSTLMFRSVNKPGMCLDDGGSTKSGTATMHLWECVPTTPNQQFVLDDDTMMIRSPRKPGLCVDDGGASGAGTTKYWLWGCNNNNKNQHFDVISPTVLQSGVSLLNSGKQLMLRVRGKNLCMDDGGGRTNAETTFVDQTCDPKSANQIFTYDTSNKLFRSVNKPGMCIDNGGSTDLGTSSLFLWKCTATKASQQFVVDPDTFTIRNPTAPNLCVDDGGGVAANATKYLLWWCNKDNTNQYFDVISPTALTVL